MFIYVLFFAFFTIIMFLRVNGIIALEIVWKTSLDCERLILVYHSVIICIMIIEMEWKSKISSIEAAVNRGNFEFPE